MYIELNSTVDITWMDIGEIGGYQPVDADELGTAIMSPNSA